MEEVKNGTLSLTSGERKKKSYRRRKLIMFSFPDSKYVINSATTLLTLHIPIKI